MVCALCLFLPCQLSNCLCYPGKRFDFGIFHTFYFLIFLVFLSSFHSCYRLSATESLLLYLLLISHNELQVTSSVRRGDAESGFYSETIPVWPIPSVKPTPSEFTSGCQAALKPYTIYCVFAAGL